MTKRKRQGEEQKRDRVQQINDRAPAEVILTLGLLMTSGKAGLSRSSSGFLSNGGDLMGRYLKVEWTSLDFPLYRKVIEFAKGIPPSFNPSSFC